MCAVQLCLAASLISSGCDSARISSMMIVSLLWTELASSLFSQGCVSFRAAEIELTFAGFLARSIQLCMLGPWRAAVSSFLSQPIRNSWACRG